jgi:hypothetical protein
VLRRILAYRLEPRIFPEDQAAGLASAVPRAVTACFEMNRISDPAPADWKYRVAGFVRAFIDLKPLAAKRQHLGHKRHAVQLRIAVECPEYFVFTPNLNPIAYAMF